MKIRECVNKILGREIFDSRGVPTVEVEIYMKEIVVRSSCPSGASTGSQEALELRDGGEVCKGKGVAKALKSVNEIVSFLFSSDIDLRNQREIDEALCKIDGTENKSRLGANAILPISVGFALLGGAVAKVPPWLYVSRLTGEEIAAKIPKLFFNVINGGAHSGNGLFVQEVMVSFEGEQVVEILRKASTFILSLKEIVREKYGNVGVGDEGGFAPPVKSLEEALELIKEGEKRSGLAPKIALDAAASEFYMGDGKYNVGWKSSEEVVSREELSAYYKKVSGKYGISIIEDPFAEKDYEGWSAFMKEAESAGMEVVGDDLIVTNKKLIREAGQKRWCNVALIKMNQIGTVTETLDAVKEARAQGMKIMASHRSGETEDTFLAHLAVGIGADYLKAGSLCRSERVCKYNELIRIFDKLRERN